jgi:16S rRNA (uracil1498-N3)-methyltransferase
MPGMENDFKISFSIFILTKFEIEMKLPLFYQVAIPVTEREFCLDEASSKHIVQVLRMQVGEQLQLTDGKGTLVTAAIVDDNRKKCRVAILNRETIVPVNQGVTIGISPVKNNSRFEWFLEKATEIGVAKIVPIICERTEKQHVKWERMQAILVSAMLQSHQAWLPVLSEPIKLAKFITEVNDTENLLKMIAHCEDSSHKQQVQTNFVHATHSLILIGPEGDFTKAEIELALENNFVPVSLGNTRLRTETAGIVAAALLCNT